MALQPGQSFWGRTWSHLARPGLSRRGLARAGRAGRHPGGHLPCPPEAPPARGTDPAQQSQRPFAAPLGSWAKRLGDSKGAAHLGCCASRVGHSPRPAERSQWLCCDVPGQLPRPGGVPVVAQLRGTELELSRVSMPFSVPDLLPVLPEPPQRVHPLLLEQQAEAAQGLPPVPQEGAGAMLQLPEPPQEKWGSRHPFRQPPSALQLQEGSSQGQSRCRMSPPWPG